MSFKEDNSLLHYAVASADVDSVRSVLGLGADVNTQSRRGYTPLIVAVLQRLHDICSLLIVLRSLRLLVKWSFVLF